MDAGMRNPCPAFVYPCALPLPSTLCTLIRTHYRLENSEFNRKLRKSQKHKWLTYAIFIT